MSAIHVGRVASETLDRIYGLLCRSAGPEVESTAPRFALIMRKDYLRDIQIYQFRRALKRRISYLRKHR